MSAAQAATVQALRREGFALDYQGRHVVRLVRGNDRRLVRLDGSQQRAQGARR